MILNNRLQTAALAVLLASVALLGAASAQGPVQTTCDAVPGPDIVPCDQAADVDEALADVPTEPPAELTACAALDPPDNVLCILDFATGQSPPVDPNAVCAQLELEGDFPACVLDAVTGQVPDPNEVVCTALESEAGAAADCASEAAQAEADGALAQVAAITAPALSALSGPTTVSVNTPVTLTGTFTTFLSRAPGPLAAFSTASGNPVNDTVASLDDVEGTVTGATGATVTVDNQAHTFSATFTPSAAGVSTLVVTLTYAEPLGLLADGPAPELVQDSESKAVTAFVPNQAPVANAGPDQTGVTGVVEFANVVLSGTGSSDPDNGPSPLGYLWTQVGGSGITLAGANTATASFVAPDVATVTSYVFNLHVSDGDLSADDTVTVEVTPSTTTANTDVEGTDADLSLDSLDFTGPVAGVASDTTLTAIVHDLNGVDTLDDGLLASSLTGPQGLDEALDFTSATDSAPEGDTDTQRAYLYDLSFPERLQDGSYLFATTYGPSAPVEHLFSVANVAPTLDSDAVVTQTFLAGHGAFVTDPVALTLDDANWGGFAGNAVVELEDLTLSGVPLGLVFQVSDDGGETWTDVSGLSHDLSAVLNGDGALGLLVRLSSPDGFVPQGVSAVSAVLTDQSAAASDPVPLFALTILPENYGFFFGVSDGGDGIAIGSGAVTPGTRNSSAADPVAVAFTGTFDADALVVSIGRFQCVTAGCDDSFGAYNADPLKNGKVLLYGTPDLSDAPVELPVTSTGAAGFDLTAGLLGAAGSTLYVVLDLYVPAGLDEGSYVGTVNIDATGDEA